MFGTTERLIRCCPSHSSYDELTEHLLTEFPDVDPTAAMREVGRAAAAARFTGVTQTDDWLLMCELVARHQLQLRTGTSTDDARLDPQSHPARRTG